MSICYMAMCTSRVEVIQDKEGGVTHVAKEIDEKEEEYTPQGVESVGEEKDENGTSVASEEEDRRAK